MDYFKYLDSPITNDARSTREMKFRVAMEKAAFNRKKLFTSKLKLNLRKNCNDTENWTFHKINQKHLESFEM
jgi:hypothetical protein